jgi:hypothetical protein
VSFDSSGGTQTITVTGISGFGVTNLKRKDVSVTIDGSSIIIDCPAVGGIVDWKDTFDITYYGDVVTSIEVAQSGSNYTVTPPTSRFGLEGGEQLITITSDYPLRDYFYYEDANGTKHYNFEIINYNEIRILYSLPASDADSNIQPILYSSMSYIKPIPLTNIFQGRYLDATLLLGEITTLKPLSNSFIVDIKSDVDWTINTDNCLVGRNDVSNYWNDS